MMTQGNFGPRTTRALVIPILVAALTVFTAEPMEGRQDERKGWLGVQVEMVDGSGRTGLPIRSVLPGGPGARAELLSGDVILRIDGAEATRESLEASLARIRPGDRLNLVVRRGDSDRDVAVIAAPRPHLPRHQGPQERMRWGDRPATGVGLRAVAGAEFRGLDPALARYFGVERGLLVLEVGEGTPAHAAGLEPGDVVKTVHDTPVRTVADLRWLVAERGSGGGRVPETLVLEVIRDGEPRTLELRIMGREPR